MYSSPICPGGNPCVNLCLNKLCKEYPSMCSSQQCNCQGRHTNCPAFKWASLYNNIATKKDSPLSKVLFESCYQLVQKMIKQLQREAEVIVDLTQLAGLNPDEVRLMSMVKDNNFSGLSSSLVASLHQTMINFVVPQKIPAETCQQIEKELGALISRIKGCYEPRNSTKDEPMEKNFRIWLKNQTYKMSGLNDQPVPSIDTIQFDKVGFLSLRSCPSQWITMLSRFTGLKELSLSNTNLNDNDAKLVADALSGIQTLSNLTLRDNSLSILGALEFSKLKTLKEVDLRNNKTEQSQKQQLEKAFGLDAFSLRL